jgi:NADP-dependent 3-hydroxy acid dehydrogenase YdfG
VSTTQNSPSPAVLITGASQGIGAAIAEVFARELRAGVRLALVARNQEKLQQVGAAARAHGAHAEVFPCDVADEAAVQRMAEAVTQRLGAVEVLINNAGAFAPRRFAETSAADFDAMIAANLRSAFLVSRAFVPSMITRGSGDVFFMSSIAGLKAYPGGAAYCAAKFGVTGLAAVLREETKASGVRVCCVHPGATWSPSWERSGVDAARIMPAEDIARAFFAVYQLSRRTVVEEIVLRPQRGDV